MRTVAKTVVERVEQGGDRVKVKWGVDGANPPPRPHAHAHLGKQGALWLRARARVCARVHRLESVSGKTRREAGRAALQSAAWLAANGSLAAALQSAARLAAGSPAARLRSRPGCRESR